MKLKKAGMMLLCAGLVFGTTACGNKEEEQTKEVATKQEETKPEIIQLTGEEVVEKFSKLKEMEEYLFTHYSSLSTEAQERGKENGDRKPIGFYCAMKDDKVNSMQPILSFDETITKKEMIDAIKYIAKELDDLFPTSSRTHFWITSNIAFIKEGILDETLLNKRGGVTLAFGNPRKGQEAKYIWKEEIDVCKQMGRI